MKGKDSIHLKVDYMNALESKKGLLNSEKSLVLISKAMKGYSEMRKKELKKRITLARKAKELASLLKKMSYEISEVHRPSVGKKHVRETASMGQNPRRKMSRHDSSIESQLQDIQRKLNDISK
jgi:hypothetical protein